uniref:Uncharacterized protein n=1 Tax=Knipowitschia caucasica TaxID=637954 RepID=A0AAV2L860_KNICA
MWLQSGSGAIGSPGFADVPGVPSFLQRVGPLQRHEWEVDAKREGSGSRPVTVTIRVRLELGDRGCARGGGREGGGGAGTAPLVSGAHTDAALFSCSRAQEEHLRRFRGKPDLSEALLTAARLCSPTSANLGPPSLGSDAAALAQKRDPRRRHDGFFDRSVVSRVPLGFLSH